MNDFLHFIHVLAPTQSTMINNNNLFNVIIKYLAFNQSILIKRFVHLNVNDASITFLLCM